MIKVRHILCVALAGASVGCHRSQNASSPSSASVAPSTSTAGAGASDQGGLTAFQAKRRASIMRADADHDGRISQQEWVAWRTAHPGRGSDPVKQFQKYDANHDGYVTPDEIDAISARLYARRQAMQGSVSGRNTAGAE